MLRKDPECRLTVEELLQHRWLKTASPTAHRPIGGAQFARSTARQTPTLTLTLALALTLILTLALTLTLTR